MAGSNIFKSQNLYQVAFCMAKGMTVSGTERKGLKTTVILKGKNATEVAMKFYDNEKVGAKTLFDNYRTLKDLVFQQ